MNSAENEENLAAETPAATNGTPEALEEAALKTVAPAKDVITYDDFAKLDIRIGTITEAERVPKSDKLLKLRVDDGMGGRQILSGIAKHFSPGLGEDHFQHWTITTLAHLKELRVLGEMVKET